MCVFKYIYDNIIYSYSQQHATSESKDLFILLSANTEVVHYLDVDDQLQKVFGRHDDGGVERDHVALVQTQIQVGGQPLKGKTNIDRPRKPELIF